MFSSNNNGIRANQLVGYYLAVSILWFVIAIVFLALFAFIIVLNIRLTPTHIELSQLLFQCCFYILAILCYTFQIGWAILQRRYWKRIEQRRLAAVRGDRSFLAIEQPIANSLSLQLPCMIKTRLSKENMLVLTGIALMFALSLAGLFTWMENSFERLSLSTQVHDFLVFFTITAVVMVILLIILFLSPLATQKIVVTEQGLSVRYQGYKGTVRWKEVRLFATYNTLGAQKSGSSITYELSSATDIARWVWVLHPNRLHINMVPTIPLDEYNRQMQALNALIVARTQVPLSDLRATSTMK